MVLQPLCRFPSPDQSMTRQYTLAREPGSFPAYVVPGTDDSTFPESHRSGPEARSRWREVAAWTR